MLPLTEARVRASFINVSKRERGAIPSPDLDAVDWDAIDLLGWRDPRQPRLGFVVGFVDDEPVGVMLRLADASTRMRPQCSWCEDVHLPNDVAFYAARRAGKAGRDGNTVGTLICEGFECSTNVRRLPIATFDGHDVHAVRERRIRALRGHVERFLRVVRDGRTVLEHT